MPEFVSKHREEFRAALDTWTGKYPDVRFQGLTLPFKAEYLAIPDQYVMNADEYERLKKVAKEENELKLKLFHLNAKLVLHQNEIGGLREQLKRYASDERRHTNRIAYLEKECDDLKQSMKAGAADNKYYKKRLDDLVRELDEAKQSEKTARNLYVESLDRFLGALNVLRNTVDACSKCRTLDYNIRTDREELIPCPWIRPAREFLKENQ